jgi:RNase adaptor protein for sRNA GlmZ degradation
VIDYLEKFDEVKQFQESARKMTGLTVTEYLNRKFNHLCVSFGCTGGQHRSVYMAEKMAKWLENNFQVKVVLYHTEECNWRTNG